MSFQHKNQVSIDIIHMDLKPKNFAFESLTLETIILLDFGISKVSRMNQNTEIYGYSNNYCPPEVKPNEISQLSPKSDIFSLGIVLYQLVTEKPAWSNSQQRDIYSLIHNHNGKLDFFYYNDRTGNQSLDKLIKGCTQYDPSSRPTAAEALEKIKMMLF